MKRYAGLSCRAGHALADNLCAARTTPRTQQHCKAAGARSRCLPRQAQYPAQPQLQRRTQPSQRAPRRGRRQVGRPRHRPQRCALPPRPSLRARTLHRRLRPRPRLAPDGGRSRPLLVRRLLLPRRALRHRLLQRMVLGLRPHHSLRGPRPPRLVPGLQRAPPHLRPCRVSGPAVML